MKLKTSFEFDAAHRLVGYKGLCSNLHGHIWKVEIEVEGDELDDVGILWDFSNVKDIKKRFDHKTILMDCVENEMLVKALHNTCGKESVVLLDYNPTAEHFAKFILKLINYEHPELNKVKVRVWESPKSCAEVEE
jgi:6-pyruvoyltetrahydropterin/6-carboxytetrahydropterin synthase